MTDTISPDGGIDIALQTVKTRLKNAITYTNRIDEEYMSWLYYCLVYNIEFQDVGFTEDQAKQAHHIWKNTDDFPDNIDEWFATYCKKKGFSYHFMVGFNGSKSIATFNANQKDRIQETYEYHKAVVGSFEKAKEIPFRTVRDFIKNPKWPKDRIPAKVTLENIEKTIKGLHISPAVTLEDARKEISQIGDHDYAGVAKYADEIGVNMRQSVSAVLDFLAAAYAIPSQTISLVENINSKRSKIMSSVDNLLEGIESSGRPKKRGIWSSLIGKSPKKPRLVSFEDSPLYEIFNESRLLSDHAKEDNALYARQIQAAQTVIEVILQYDDSLASYTKALEERVDKIKSANNSADKEELSARDIVNAALSNEWTDKLHSLKANREFAKLHAGNLAVALDKMTDMQLQIEAMSGLSPSLAMPYQNAQRAFMGYQSLQFGQASDMSGEIIEGTVSSNNLTREQTYKIIENALDTTCNMIENLSDNTRSSRTELINVLEQSRTKTHSPP